VPVPVPVLPVPAAVLAELDDGLGVEFVFIDPDPELDPQAARTAIAPTGSKDFNLISTAPLLVYRKPKIEFGAAKNRLL
jgi:hypothetical protein